MEEYFHSLQTHRKSHPFKSDKEIIRVVLLKLFYSGIGTGLILFILSNLR